MKRYDHSPEKPFHIQRKRLGEIKYMRPEGDFGFIDAEDFREDVFFHKSAWQGEVNGRVRDPQVGFYVEFEIDEAYREKEKKLRASVVRPTNRPMGRKLAGRDAPHLVNKHHPKALRKRPTWRGGDGPLARPPKLDASNLDSPELDAPKMELSSDTAPTPDATTNTGTTPASDVQSGNE